MADGAARFRQGFSGPALLRVLLGNKCMPDTGLSPSMAALSKALSYTFIVHIAALQPQRARPLVWPNPRSLATTCGITFVFFSSSYLDVSVRRVDNLCSQIFNLWGSPIRTRADQSVVCTYPRIFAAYRVLRRPQEPRHPPCALIHFLLFVQRQIFGYQNFLDQNQLFTQIALSDLYYYTLPTLSMNFCSLHPFNINVVGMKITGRTHWNRTNEKPTIRYSPPFGRV